MCRRQKNNVSCWKMVWKSQEQQNQSESELCIQPRTEAFYRSIDQTEDRFLVSVPPKSKRKYWLSDVTIEKWDEKRILHRTEDNWKCDSIQKEPEIRGGYAWNSRTSSEQSGLSCCFCFCLRFAKERKVSVRCACVTFCNRMLLFLSLSHFLCPSWTVLFSGESNPQYYRFLVLVGFNFNRESDRIAAARL